MSARQRDDSGTGGGFSGIVKGLTDLVEKLEELGKDSQELHHTGEFGGKGAKDIKGVYGFTVKVGLGDQGGLKVEPFGNVHTDKASGKAVVQEVREPMVDVFEESDFVLIVAEMPGVAAEDVKLEVNGDVLTISAEQAERKYRKEVLLPGPLSRDKMKVACNNGVIEIKCLR
jgi:HSP20 family protein